MLILKLFKKAISQEMDMEIEQCIDLLLKNTRTKETTMMVHITKALGMVTGEDIVSKVMVPAFPKSAMDGYAVLATDVVNASKENPIELNVVDELLAGDYKDIAHVKGSAVRIMTGAYVPTGYDTVIPQEMTDYGENTVKIYKSLNAYSNYCKIGEDVKEGEDVIPKYTILTSIHIGILASIGIEWVCVLEPVRVAIISTGSEIVDVGTKLMPGKTYNSIAYMISASVKKEHFLVSSMEICEDDKEIIKNSITKALNQADIIITTGGVSVGKRDLLPAVLEELGANILFHGANIQPGTPTMASVLEDKIILSLSGNPYAAIANFELYFWPITAKIMNNTDFEVIVDSAVLDSEYNKINKHRRLVRACAYDGKVAIKSNVHASSVIHNMAECNCFIDLEAKKKVVPGDKVVIRYIRGI